MRTYIKVQFDFEGFHLYSGAPEEVAYLRTLHRHMFNVHCTIEVFHDDRELEFIMVKNDLIKKINELYPDKKVGSCEMVARDIYKYIKDKYNVRRMVKVEVYEDKENGGIITD